MNEARKLMLLNAMGIKDEFDPTYLFSQPISAFGLSTTGTPVATDKTLTFDKLMDSVEKARAVLGKWEMEATVYPVIQPLYDPSVGGFPIQGCPRDSLRCAHLQYGCQPLHGRHSGEGTCSAAGSE